MNRLDLPRSFKEGSVLLGRSLQAFEPSVLVFRNHMQRDFVELYWGHSRILKLPQYGITSFVLHSSYLGHDPVNRAAIA